VNEGNDPAEQQPERFDASECFVEAAANLRVAEQLASHALGYDEKVNQVAYIADVWIRLGVALDNAAGFDQRFPIPIRLVGDEDPQSGWLKPIRLEDRTPLVPHQWHEISGFCITDGCCAQRWDDNVDAFSCPAIGVVRDAAKHEHSSITCGHTWVRPMEPCANGCGKRPLPGQPDNDDFPWELCPQACPDINA
jgi:hypothetical protein